MARKKLTELDKIEERLEVLRVKEAVIRKHCWEEFERLMEPTRRWVQQQNRTLTQWEQQVYKNRLDAAHKKAMAGLWRIQPIADEAAKLRTRRCELEYQARQRVTLGMVA